jgi:hypothetical protein
MQHLIIAGRLITLAPPPANRGPPAGGPPLQQAEAFPSNIEPCKFKVEINAKHWQIRKEAKF